MIFEVDNHQKHLVSIDVDDIEYVMACEHSDGEILSKPKPTLIISTKSDKEILVELDTFQEAEKYVKEFSKLKKKRRI